MHMEGNQRGSADTGSAGLGTDGNTLTEVAEPNYFGAAGDRLLVHLSSSKITACPGDTRTTTNSFNVLVEEPEQQLP